MGITIQQLKQITGVNNINFLTSAVNGINETLNKYNINTPLRIAHFLAQILHESGYLKTLKENLNYSVQGLTKTFKKYFINEAEALPYARNQEKIANKVYANRMGNGPESSGDGWKYRGRGVIMITGKDNYTTLSKDTGIDFVKKPQLLEQMDYAIMSGGWYWNKNNLSNGKFGALVVCSKYPKVDTKIQRAKLFLASKHKTPLHVVTQNLEYDFDALLSIRGPFST